MVFHFLGLFVWTGVLGLSGCSTTASKERLEKQNQLLILEIQNHEHAEETLKSEIESLKTLLGQAEQKLSDLSQSSEDKNRAFEELKKSLALEGQKKSEIETSCQALIEQIKTGLASGKLQSKAYREQLIQTLNEWKSQRGSLELDSAKTTH
jgi:chromosome segregation ATPase